MSRAGKKSRSFQVKESTSCAFKISRISIPQHTFAFLTLPEISVLSSAIANCKLSAQGACMPQECATPRIHNYHHWIILDPWRQAVRHGSLICVANSKTSKQAPACRRNEVFVQVFRKSSSRNTQTPDFQPSFFRGSFSAVRIAKSLDMSCLFTHNIWARKLPQILLNSR